VVKTIDRFSDKYFFLSNFYPFLGNHPIAPVLNIKYDGITYPTSEHAFQAAKTFSTEAREVIARCTSPGQAKRMGRVVPLRKDWETARIHVMDNILWIKFEEPKLNKKLLKTEGYDLIEGNTWHDTFWGRCYCEKHKGRGENWLGKLLMQLRDEFIADMEGA